MTCNKCILQCCAHQLNKLILCRYNNDTMSTFNILMIRYLNIISFREQNIIRFIHYYKQDWFSITHYLTTYRWNNTTLIGHIFIIHICRINLINNHANDTHCPCCFQTLHSQCFASETGELLRINIPNNEIQIDMIILNQTLLLKLNRYSTIICNVQLPIIQVPTLKQREDQDQVAPESVHLA